MKKTFAYDVEFLLSGNEELVELEKRSINLRFGSEFVLLISPKPDDEKLKLHWPEEKKMSIAPGALASNQLLGFCWNKTDGKWLPNPPNFEGDSMMYQMFGAHRDAEEHSLVVRQYCDPKRNGHHERFLMIVWSKTLLSLTSKENGIDNENR